MMNADDTYVAPVDLSSLLQPSGPNDADTDLSNVSSSFGGIAMAGLHGSPLALTPSSDLSATLRSENRLLKSRLRQVQTDLQTEHDCTCSLRKRLNSSEKLRLDAVVKTGEEISVLDAEVTRLRAQLERGEAVRQNLEFELTKSSRTIAQERRSANDRENTLAELKAASKQKNAELCQQMSVLTRQLGDSKSSLEQLAVHHSRTIDTKDQDLSERRCELDLIEVEKERLVVSSLQKDSTISELQEKIQRLEGDLRDAADNNGRLARENEALVDAETRLKTELQEAMDRVMTLDAKIEAERAAHLESKFNSEIVQLRIRDLDAALQMEKTNKSDALATSDTLSQKLGDLQQAYAEERQCGLATKDRLENSWEPLLRAEQEYEALGRQLQQELSDKRAVIGQLSAQLDSHQKSFDQLKQELGKAKKRQTQLEETYHSCMRELDVLLHKYTGGAERGVERGVKVEAANRRTAKGHALKVKAADQTKCLAPALLLDGLSRLLFNNRRQLQAAADNTKKLSQQKFNLMDECARYKDLISGKDNAIKVAQQSLAETSRDKKHLAAERKELSGAKKQLEGELGKTTQQLTTVRGRAEQLKEQLQKANSRIKSEEQIVVCFLQGLHQQLVAASSAATGVTVTTEPVTTFTDLSVVISELVICVLMAHQGALEKSSQLEKEVVRRAASEVDLRASFEAQMETLAGATDGQVREWQQQRQQLQEHYSQVLTQAQARHKKSQSEASQSSERAQRSEAECRRLELELGRERADSLLSLRERRALLAATALLSGALWPLQARVAQLASQRHLLGRRVARLDAFVQRVTLLTDSLSLMDDGFAVGRRDADAVRRAVTLRRFRAVVVAVLAANRLAYMARVGARTRMFTSRAAAAGGGRMNVSVCVGGLVAARAKPFTGVASEQSADQTTMVYSSADAITWLSSSNLLAAVMTSVCDLETILQKACQGADFDPSDIVHAARDGYDRLQRHLATMFPVGAETESPPDSLLHRLTPSGGASPYDATVGRLKAWVGEVAGRLHDSVVTTRDLKAEVARAGRERQREEERRREELEEFVSRDKFAVLCEEQATSLQRELQAQTLLSEQATSLNELAATLDAEVKVKVQRERELLSLRSQYEATADTMRQLRHRASRDDGETQELRRNVYDAETALRTAAKDRDELSLYMKTILEELDKLRIAVTSGSEPPFAVLLSAAPPSGRPPPQLTACQTLVAAFVETHRQQGALIRSLREDVDSHRRHTAALRDELGAVCRRQYGEEFDQLMVGGSGFVPLATTTQTAGKVDLGSLNRYQDRGEPVDIFIPLQEDISELFETPRVTKPSTDAATSHVTSKRSLHGGRRGRGHRVSTAR